MDLYLSGCLYMIGSLFMTLNFEPEEGCLKSDVSFVRLRMACNDPMAGHRRYVSQRIKRPVVLTSERPKRIIYLKLEVWSLPLRF